MNFDEKVRELAARHEIPTNLLREAIELEQGRVVLRNRRAVPKLIELIARHSEAGSSGEASE